MSNVLRHWLLPGLIAGCAAYSLSRPVIAAYQKARIARMKKAYEKRQRKAVHIAAGRERKT